MSQQIRPCQKDLCLIYSLGVDYAKLMEFTEQNPTGELFMKAMKAMVYAKRLVASWYGYDTGVLKEDALGLILKGSLSLCQLVSSLGIDSQYCRRYTYYDAVPCKITLVYNVDEAYSTIIHMIANYNAETVSDVLTRMTKYCEGYEVKE